MSSAAEASSLSLLLGHLAVHQDLLWFGVLVGWSLVFVVWQRHPQRESLWLLLPWIASARVAGALVQFLVFNPPFDFFLDRLVPGTNATYLPAALDPNLTADLLLAAISAALIALWWWQDATARGRRLLRWVGWLFPVVVVPVHWVWPELSTWLLGVLPLLPAWRLLQQRGRDGTAWLTLLPGAFVPLLSTIGPVALHAGMLQRTAVSTPMGAIAAVFQLLTAALLLDYLLRARRRALGSGPGVAPPRLARPYLQAAALALVVGLGFALQTGRDNREEVLNGRLRTTHYQAGLLDPVDFTRFTAADFTLQDLRPAPDGGTARLPTDLLAGQRDASEALAARVRATQFQEEANFLVIREGWLVAVASWPAGAVPGQVRLLRPASAEDRAAWAEHRLYRIHSPVPEQGAPYACRSPVLARDGRMLGWFEYPRREFYSSMARKWRTGPLLVTALGIVLTAVLYFQKRASLEREHALRDAAVEAEANRLKTAFLAKVSHELRTPIQSLLGYGELLQSRVGHDPQARAWLGALRQHGEIMTRLINDLLDLSAAESGAFRLTPRPIDPTTLVRQIVDGLAARAAAKGLRLECVITPAVPAWVEADGGRLAQVVLNLAGNAVKFTDAGEVRVVLDATPEPDGRVRLQLTVHDTGPGIALAEQAQLFAPFARLERTAAKEGSGLGLALSAVLCRAMQGGLTVESDGVHGSCFRAEFRVPPTSPPVELFAAPAASAAPPRVLVVDDNTLVRELFGSFLRDRGCGLATAATGAEALTLARTHAPEVIVLDLSLPDADGVSLMPGLRAAAPAARFIGVSAHAGHVDRERALAAGMTAFFSKPVELATLWAAMMAGSAAATPPAGYRVPPHLQAVFRRELPVLRTELAAAVAAGDLSRVRRRAHYLRNSALVVEARDLLDACSELETAAERAAPAALTAAWQRCETVLAARADSTD